MVPARSLHGEVAGGSHQCKGVFTSHCVPKLLAQRLPSEALLGTMETGEGKNPVNATSPSGSMARLFIQTCFPA